MPNEKATRQMKTWSAPQLKTLGKVADIVQQQNKNFGPTDGFTFQGNPIQNTS